MPISFFYTSMCSQHCRAVALTASALGVALTKHHVPKQVSRTENYYQTNPVQTVPAIDDDGFKLFESPAIMLYLFNRFGKDDSLYPKDPQKRALVDQALYYEGSIVMPSWADYARPIIFELKTPTDAAVDKFKATLDSLNHSRLSSQYLTGDKLTLADLSLAATLSSTEVVDFDLTPWEHLSAWLNKIKTLPYYKEANQEGIDEFKKIVEERKRLARILGCIE